MAKFSDGKRWGCNWKQRNLKKRWQVCMEVVCRKCTDDESLKRIMQMEKIVDDCAKELERNMECESMFYQADHWMRKRNKTLAEDGHREICGKK